MTISAEDGQASFVTRLQPNDSSYHVPNNSFQLKMDLSGVINIYIYIYISYTQNSFYWIHEPSQLGILK